jgi:hypothetical protein
VQGQTLGKESLHASTYAWRAALPRLSLSLPIVISFLSFLLASPLTAPLPSVQDAQQHGAWPGVGVLQQHRQTGGDSSDEDDLESQMHGSAAHILRRMSSVKSSRSAVSGILGTPVSVSQVR